MDELINTSVNKTAAQSVDDRPHNIYCQFNDRFNVSELTCVTLSMLTICTWLKQIYSVWFGPLRCWQQGEQ